MRTAERSTAQEIRVLPVEAIPLAHFLPGSSVLHLGHPLVALAAAGQLESSMIVQAARSSRCSSVIVPHDMAEPLTEPVASLFDDVRRAGLRWIAIADADVMHESSLALVSRCDAAIVRINPDVRTARGMVSDWVESLVVDSPVWVEILACLVPGMNDGDASIHDLASWTLGHLGADMPLHFGAAGCDDPADLPESTLRRARSIALGDGLNYVYTSPASDRLAGTTLCPGCGERVIERQGTLLAAYRLTAKGRCHACATPVAGIFDGGWKGPAAISLADG